MSKDEQQKRGGFVALGDLALDLPDVPVPAQRDRRRQTRHHFTSLDQIDQLIDARNAPAYIGFMARLLALCSLPRTNPGDRLQFKRVNGRTRWSCSQAVRPNCLTATCLACSC